MVFIYVCLCFWIYVFENGRYKCPKFIQVLSCALVNYILINFHISLKMKVLEKKICITSNIHNNDQQLESLFLWEV